MHAGRLFLLFDILFNTYSGRISVKTQPDIGCIQLFAQLPLFYTQMLTNSARMNLPSLKKNLGLIHVSMRVAFADLRNPAFATAQSFKHFSSTFFHQYWSFK